MEMLAGRSPVPVVVHAPDDRRLPAARETALYFVAAEAVTNVAKYAGATRCDVYWRRRADHVDLRIEDDGVGFDPASVSAEDVRRAKGVILSGGPASVYAPGAPTMDPQVFRQGTPVLRDQDVELINPASDAPPAAALVRSGLLSSRRGSRQ